MSKPSARSSRFRPAVLRVAALAGGVAILAGALAARGAAIQSVVGAPPPVDGGFVEVPCDPDNGGLDLRRGFCALVVADGLGRARHLAVRDNGDIYVRMRAPTARGAVLALRDTDGDGRADVVRGFGEVGGTGIEIFDGHLYYSTDTAVLRRRLGGRSLLPDGEEETVVSGFPVQADHRAKAFTFDARGRLYVDVGGPSNACQEEARTPGSPGLDPCPQLRRQGGIWRFRAGRAGQTQADGRRYATGIRNAVAMDWNRVADELHVVQHGRDSLHGLWPGLFDERTSARLPAEELQRVEKRSDFGWPYCYYDQVRGKRVLAPEYGGDGRRVGRCAAADDPVATFPGHWAPNDLIFYDGTSFPRRYRGAAFVAFHGSSNRTPLRQKGYKVAFLRFVDGRPVGSARVFADGFAGREVIRHSREAEHRAMGLAVGPDGSLYISDSVRGRIWRVVYVGRR